MTLPQQLDLLPQDLDLLRLRLAVLSFKTCFEEALKGPAPRAPCIKSGFPRRASAVELVRAVRCARQGLPTWPDLQPLWSAPFEGFFKSSL